MDKIELTAERRDGKGKGPAKRLRRAGKVPGVYYSHGAAAVPVVIEAREIAAIMRKAARSALLQLKSGDTELNLKFALIRDLVIDPIKDNYVHLDLQGVSLQEQITVAIPVHYVGTAKGEKLGEGKAEILIYDLKITTRADNIPHGIEVDVSDMDVGSVIHAGDLKLPDGVVLAIDPHAPLVHVEVRKEYVAPVAAAVPAEGEAAAATPAEGATPAQPAGK